MRKVENFEFMVSAHEHPNGVVSISFDSGDIEVITEDGQTTINPGVVDQLSSFIIVDGVIDRDADFTDERLNEIVTAEGQEFNDVEKAKAYYRELADKYTI